MVSLPYPQLDGHNPYSPGRASFMPESVRIDLGHNLPSLPWERGQRVTVMLILRDDQGPVTV